MLSMKLLAGVMFAFTLAGLAAHATEPLPQEKTLIEATTKGGLINLPAHGVRISDQGHIQGFSGTQVKNLGQFSSYAITGLRSDIEATDGNLIDQEPQAPKCMDVPVTDYNVTKKDGSLQTVARQANCHTYLASGGETIKNLMDALSDLNKGAHVPCAIIDCAAPPAGCHYSNPPQDENGCISGCGQLVCRRFPRPH